MTAQVFKSYPGLEHGLHESRQQNHSKEGSPFSVDSVVAQEIRSQLSDRGNVFILCAEPDMGKTTTISDIGSYVRSLQGYYKYIDLAHIDASRIVSTIVSLCRNASHSIPDYEYSVLAFDNIPYFDDNTRYKCIRAIKKCCIAGVNILLAESPDNDTVIQELPDAIVYKTNSFVLNGFAFDPAFERNNFGKSLWSFTHGIPRLVRGALLAGSSCTSCLDENQQYLASLADVAVHATRPSFIKEERLLRFAMIEMGRGKLCDLEEVCGPVDPTLYESIGLDSPYFGVDLTSLEFSCAGQGSIAGLASIIGRMHSEVSGLSALTLRVCSVLVIRGDYRRAGLLLMTCETEQRVSFALKYPTEFIDAGYLHMVAQSVSIASEAGDVSAVGSARIALGCVRAPAKEYASLCMRYESVDVDDSTRLLVELRDTLSNGKPDLHDLDSKLKMGPDITRDLSISIKGLLLLHELRYGDAYVLLLGSLDREQPSSSLVSCLMWAEYFFALGMSGNTPTADDLSGFDQAVRFAAKTEATPLVAILSAVEPLVSVLAGRSEVSSNIDSCAQRAGLMGMDRLQALCLIAAAIADQRAGAHARAYVRLGQASELAARVKDSYAIGVCHLLSCATRSSLGETVSASEVLSIRMPARLSMVARVFAAVVEHPGTVDLEALGKVRVGACPAGTSWLINVLAHEYGDLSQRFRDFAPRGWIDNARRTALVAGELGSHTNARSKERAASSLPYQGYQLDISVLGGFSVSVNGVPIDESRLERRRAKSLLTLLAAMPDHRVKRYEVMESIWPEYDYHDARQRVYEATSVLRTELTTKLGIDSVNPFVSNRGAGTLGLHPGMVHCDVDGFEGLARSVLSASNMRPSEVLDSCSKLEGLYRGELFVPQVDGAGMVASRRDELRQLYADVMVLASGHALALGNVQVAVHYAENACGADEMREDAELCLLKALAGAGRRLEAEVSYRGFTDRIVKKMKRPPSRKLREAYGQLIAGGEDGVRPSKTEGGATAASA